VHDEIDAREAVAQRRGQHPRVPRHVRVGNDTDRYGTRAQYVGSQ
jgi:hypothetical protein